MTIKQFRDLLYAADTNLATEFTLPFVENTMKEDFDRIITGLRDYTGDDQRGVVEAGEWMVEALRNLYTVYASLLNSDTKNTVEIINIRVYAFVLCREHLQKAYDQLEHLAGYLPNPPDSNE